MRFPFSLTRSMTSYLLRKKLAGEKKFPLVLMLEPLHACNLSCAGCGRIREYADTMHRRLSIEQCLAAAAECGAPIVSVCGGEPLIYPEIEVLVESLILRRKHVYLCTNGTLLERRFAAFARAAGCSSTCISTGWRPRTTAWSTGRACSPRPSEASSPPKKAGFNVCTNTTIYRDTNMHEIAVLFEYLASWASTAS